MTSIALRRKAGAHEAIGYAGSPRLMAVVAGGLWCAGAGMSLVVAMLPHADATVRTAYLAVAVIAGVTALLLRVAVDRLPLAVLHVSSALGAIMISVCVYLSGQASGGPPADTAILYLWVVLYSAYFFDRRQAVLQLAMVAVAYLAVLLLTAESPDLGTRWAATVAALGIVAVLVQAVRERVSELVERLSDAARTDPLTGLENRRGFEETIGAELERVRLTGQPLTVLVGDLDHFKRLNDGLGHPAGDAALVRVGQLLLSDGRHRDRVARTGGEEFALILPHTSDQEAYAVAERLRGSVERAFGKELVGLTMSFGVASYPKHGTTTDGLIVAADQALYAAKELGRNRSVIFSDEIKSLVRARPGSSEMHLSTLLSLAEALDLRDSGTADHCRTVGRYCALIATQLGLTAAEVHRVEIAGILHDIGKIGLPDAILQKPGRLSGREWVPMRRHPEIGARILRDDNLADIRSWIIAHHERPDGEGYPHGLSGAEIPLEARILAVADAYEAMTADRPYRGAVTPNAARVELLRCAGSQFDDRVVAAFLAALNGGMSKTAEPAAA